MKQQIMFGAMGFAILPFAAQTASSQATRNCASGNVLVERLAEKFGESRRSVGLGANQTRQI